MTEDIQFTIGKHSARLDGVEQRLIELQDSQKEQTAMLQKLVNRGERVRGGAWVLTSAGSALVAVAALLVDWLKK